MNKAEEKYYEEKFDHTNSKISTLKAHVESGYDLIHNEVISNHKSLNEKLDLILDQTKKTNGRVTILEDKTKTVVFFSERPRLTLFILILILLSPDLLSIIKVAF